MHPCRCERLTSISPQRYSVRGRRRSVWWWCSPRAPAARLNPIAIHGFSTKRRRRTWESWAALPASPSRGCAGRDPRSGPAQCRRKFSRHRHRDVPGGLSLVGRQRLPNHLHSAQRDERRPGAARHFSLASTIEYRTGFLSWFALLPLLEPNGLGRLVHILYFFAHIPAFRICAHLHGCRKEWSREPFRRPVGPQMTSRFAIVSSANIDPSKTQRFFMVRASKPSAS